MAAENTRQTVAAIIISYNPNPAVFTQLTARIAAQVDHLVLVDNASSPPLRTTLAEQAAARDALLLENTENLGLATGQRQGIEAALNLGVAFILLLDQDSLPAPYMVARLLAAYYHLSQQGLRIAGVGPRAVSQSHLRAMPFVRFTLCAAIKGHCHGSDDLIRTDFLISSGLLTRLLMPNG